MAEREELPKGCGLGCAYFFLSYPLNWAFIKFVMIPHHAGTAHAVTQREIDFYMFMSPLFLPIEIGLDIFFRAIELCDKICRVIF
jgi:hypothetical protein